MTDHAYRALTHGFQRICRRIEKSRWIFEIFGANIN